MAKRPFEGDFLTNTDERSNNIVIVRTYDFPAKKLKSDVSDALFQPPLPPEKQNVELNDIPVPPPPLPMANPQVTTPDKDQKCSVDKIVMKSEKSNKKNPIETVTKSPAEIAKDVSEQKSSESDENISASEPKSSASEDKNSASEVMKSEKDKSKTSPSNSWATNYLKSIGQTYMKPNKINISLQKKSSAPVKQILEKYEENNNASKSDETDKDVQKNKEVIMDKPRVAYKPETLNNNLTEINTAKKTEVIPLNTNSQHVSCTKSTTVGCQFDANLIPNANSTLINIDHFPYGTAPLPAPLQMPHEYYCCNLNNNLPPELHTPTTAYAPHSHHNISYDPYEAHRNNNFMLDTTLHEHYPMNTHLHTPPYLTDRNASDSSYLERVDKFLAKVSQGAPYDRYDKDRSVRRRVSVDSITSRRKIYHDYHRSKIKYESNPRDRDDKKSIRYDVSEKPSKSEEKQIIHKFRSKDHKTPERFQDEINKKSRGLRRRNSIEESDTENNSSSDDSTQHDKKLRVRSKPFIEKTQCEKKTEINTNKTGRENNNVHEGTKKRILPAYENITEGKINKHIACCENEVEIIRKEQPRRSNSSEILIAPHNTRKSDKKSQNYPPKNLRIPASECHEEEDFNLSKKYNESRTKVKSGSRISEEHEYNKSSKIEEKLKRRATKRKASEFTEDGDIKCCNMSPRENKKQKPFSINERETASHSPCRHDDKAHLKSTIKKARVATPKYTEGEGKFIYNREGELRDNTRTERRSYPKSEKNTRHSRKSEENEHNRSSSKREYEWLREELNPSKHNKNYDKNITEIDRKKRCLSNSDVDDARNSPRTPEGTKLKTSTRKQDNKEKPSSKEKHKKTKEEIIAQKIKKYTEELKKIKSNKLRRAHENKPENTSEIPSTSKRAKDCDYTKRQTPQKSPKKFKDNSEFYTTENNYDLRSKLSRPNINQFINKFRAKNSEISETLREEHENFVITVANDAALQSQESVTDTENTVRKTKNKRVKKIKKISVIFEESDSSEKEEKSADEVTKKSSSVSAGDFSFLYDINIDEIASTYKSLIGDPKDIAVGGKTAGNNNHIEECVISDDDSDASTVHLEEVECTHNIDNVELPDVAKAEFDKKDDKNLLRDILNYHLLLAEQRYQEKTDLNSTMGNDVGNNIGFISSYKIKQEIEDKAIFSPINNCPNKSENAALQTPTSIQGDDKEFFKKLFTPMMEIKEEPIGILSDDEASANNNLDISKFIDNKLETAPNTTKLIDDEIIGDHFATIKTIKITLEPVYSDDVASPKESMFPNESDCLTNNINTIKSEPMETEHNTDMVTESNPITGLSEENCIYISNAVNDNIKAKKEPEESAHISLGDNQNQISVAPEATNTASNNNAPKDNAQQHEIKTKPQEMNNVEADSSSKLKLPKEKSTTKNVENINESILQDNLKTNNNNEKNKSDCNFIHATSDMIKSNATSDIVKLTKEFNSKNNETVNANQQNDDTGQKENDYDENTSTPKWSDDNAVNVKSIIEQLEIMFEETDAKKQNTKDELVQLTASGTHSKELEEATTKNGVSETNVEPKLAPNSEKPLHQDKEVENEENTAQKLSPVSISESESKFSDKIKETCNAEKPSAKDNQNCSKVDNNETQSNLSSNKNGNKSRCHSPTTAPSSDVALSSKTLKVDLPSTPKSFKIVKSPLNSRSLPQSAGNPNSNIPSPKYSKAAKAAKQLSPALKNSTNTNGSKPSLPSTSKIQQNSSTTTVASKKTSLAISKVENIVGGIRPNEQNLVQNLKTRMAEYLKESCDVTALIHRGKFSKIFKCRDAEGNDAVVKIINARFDRYTTGVMKEQMLIKLQSEIPEKNLSIVRVLDGFSANGQWCFLMEYYPKNLSQALEESEKPFHIDQVQHLSRQLATALASLRNHNIVHSDIKPSHVLLNATNDRLKLCGFDEAYYEGCKPVPNIGTVNYRAPEIILGYSTSFSIDVWSTALVMFEMATKRQLFPGCFNNDILFKQMCTVGLVPLDMIQMSRFGRKHFDGGMFMRRMGDKGQDIIYHNPDKIYKNNILQGTIRGVHTQYWCRNSSKQQRQQDFAKINQFCALLEQMLVMHPTQRLPIEFVYASTFLLKLYDNSSRGISSALH